MRVVCVLAVALGALAIPGPAAAQRVWEAEASANVGMNQTVTETIQADPMADPEDRQQNINTQYFTDIRPSIAVQAGSERTLWRFAYLFSGSLSLDAEGSTTYNNQLEASVASQLTKSTVASLAVSASQGSQTFLLTSRSADMGTPDLRAPGNPSTVAAAFGEGLNVELGRSMALDQNLVGTFNAPQDDTARYSGALAGTLGLERNYPRDSFGFELRSSIARLQPQQVDRPQYTSTTNGVAGRWNHDFTYEWNGSATLGIEQVYTDTGSQPLAISPIGTIAAVYNKGNRGGAIEFSHATTTNIQVGTISVTDRVAARGTHTLDVQNQRIILGSIGFLHNEPIGEAAEEVAAGTGNAVQVDAGFQSRLNDTFNFTARYSIAYQFGQAGGLGPTLAQVVLVGVTARYSNFDANQITRSRSARGRRVDRSDGLFPVVDEEPVNAAP